MAGPNQVYVLSALLFSIFNQSESITFHGGHIRWRITIKRGFFLEDNLHVYIVFREIFEYEKLRQQMPSDGSISSHGHSLLFKIRFRRSNYCASQKCYLNSSVMMSPYVCNRNVHELVFFFFHIYLKNTLWGHQGCDRMVVGFTTTSAISPYHHSSCEFEPCSWWGILDTKLCDQVCDMLVVFFRYSGFLHQ